MARRKQRRQYSKEQLKKIRINLIVQRTIYKKDLRKYRRLEGYVATKRGKFKRKIYAPINKDKDLKTAREKKPYYRYSIAYFINDFHGSIVRKTFRAEVYSNMKQDENRIKKALILNLKEWVSQHNSNIQAMFNDSIWIGYESEEIGINDIGQSQLNRIRCFFER